MACGALCSLAASLLIALAPVPGAHAQQTAAAPLAAASAQAMLAQPSNINISLTGDIMERLITDRLLQNTAITASVSGNGDVSLNGVVARQELAERAVAVVKSVAGVKNVTSNILVNADPFAPPPPPLPSPLPPISAALPPPAASNEPQAQLARALAAAPGLERVGTRIVGGQVLLFGTVETKSAVQQAEKIAHEVVPKLALKNIIWVDPHPLSPPPLIPKA